MREIKSFLPKRDFSAFVLSIAEQCVYVMGQTGAIFSKYIGLVGVNFEQVLEA